MRHSFTDKIDEILKKYFADDFEQIFKNSELLQYINIKNSVYKPLLVAGLRRSALLVTLW